MWRHNINTPSFGVSFYNLHTFMTITTFVHATETIVPIRFFSNCITVVLNVPTTTVLSQSKVTRLSTAGVISMAVGARNLFSSNCTSLSSLWFAIKTSLITFSTVVLVSFTLLWLNVWESEFLESFRQTTPSSGAVNIMTLLWLLTSGKSRAGWLIVAVSCRCRSCSISIADRYEGR